MNLGPANPPHLTKNKMVALRRRLDHLSARIANSDGRDLSYDKAEAAALQHAIILIEHYNLCTSEAKYG